MSGAGGRSHSLRAGPDDAGTRLDRFLAAALPHLSRSRIQALVEAGHVRLAGRAARAATRLHAGDELELVEPPAEPAVPQPEPIPLRIVHEDADLIVVDKPAGLSVHPGAGEPRGTLVNALLAHVSDLRGVGGVMRPGIVHRLDKGTSGLLVAAKHDAALVALQRQFAARRVEKEYRAIVLGLPRSAAGTIDAPIGRDPIRRQRMSVRADGRAARSAYRVLERLDGAALVAVTIETGRTHQVRVHLASVGHPLAGDPTYAGRKRPSCRSPEARSALAAFPRPALHAAVLAFAHPTSGERRRFESPLPEDMETLLAVVRASKLE